MKLLAGGHKKETKVTQYTHLCAVVCSVFSSFKQNECSYISYPSTFHAVIFSTVLFMVFILPILQSSSLILFLFYVFPHKATCFMFFVLVALYCVNFLVPNVCIPRYSQNLTSQLTSTSLWSRLSDSAPQCGLIGEFHHQDHQL